jgi:hypothetical protein
VPRIEIDDAKQIRVVASTDTPEAKTKAFERIKQLGSQAGLDRIDKAVNRIHLDGKRATDDENVLGVRLPKLLAKVKSCVPFSRRL